MAGTRWEAFEEEHLRRFLTHFDVDCVFDVGANRGQYRDMLRDAADFAGTIISFEPIPELVEQMMHRKASLGDRNWLIEHVALGSEPGTAAFNVMANDRFSSFKMPSHEETSLFVADNQVVRQIMVPCDTFEHQFVIHQTSVGFARAFLKLDTQGHDLDVIAGAGDGLERLVGLQSALSIRRIHEDSRYFDEALAVYRQLGFQLSALVPDNDDHFPDLIGINCIMYRRSALPQALP